MAFGFPAYHTERYESPDTKLDLHRLVVDALEDIRWSLGTVSRRTIFASTGISLWSWGEDVTITFRSAHEFEITSKCTFPTQCFDWGRNRRNVQKFLDQLERLTRSSDQESW